MNLSVAWENLFTSMKKNLVQHNILILLCFTGLLHACSQIKPGVAPRLTDPVPDGVIEAKGSFTGTGISGTAAVYRTADNSRILRLEDIVVPAAARVVFLEADGASVFNTTLRSVSGNQNYATGISVSQNWSEVTIRQTTNTADPAVATAVLIR